MPLKLISAPAERAVSLLEAKAHLRVDHADEDALISIFLDAALAHLDGRDGVLGRALVTQTWELPLDAFPRDTVIGIPLAPVQSVTSIQYRDAAGALQTFLAANYVLDAISEPARIDLAPGASWPGTQDVPNAVTIRFVAGYGAATTVPPALKAAVLLLVGHLYRNREATTAEALAALPMGVDALIAPFRIISF